MKTISENIIKQTAIESVVIKSFIGFKELLSRRLDSISILMIGEDSVRYDFFNSVTKTLNLNPWELQLEYPVHDESFIPRLDPKSKRKEKPQIDLVISNENFRTAFEFGLFRRNSNPNGTVNKTGRTLKMINDFVRLGLHAHFTGDKCYFICVADSFMLNHRMDCRVYDSFPASKYIVTLNEINKLTSSVKTGEFFDDRFFKKAELLNLSTTANLVFESEIKAKTLDYKTMVLIWCIESAIEK